MKNMGKWKLAGAGFVCCALAVFALFDTADKSGWRKADAEVLSVEQSCAMKATEYKVGYKEISEATISCDTVELFKMVHADKDWSVTEKFDGTLRVTAADGSSAQAHMDLNRKEGRAPQAGDRFEVLQDPANPAEVARTDAAGTSAMIAVIFGVIGAGIMWLVFRPGGEKRKKSSVPGMALDEEADAKASAARADAMIAAALAKRGGAPARASAQPVQTAPKAGMPKAGMRAGSAPMVQPAARTGFGLKR